ncbi:hypothetical protein AAFF_G00360000 [Aldrovandia affinis]|uniref:Uncharacterized protein n=1 Tax=Aldrovandia affinis TaxID=143900 RepID=A0AAD7SI96_9TELE|nr:hypothetical protein AAFF_G00360000 [Aldrovandia affinis]
MPAATARHEKGTVRGGRDPDGRSSALPPGAAMKGSPAQSLVISPKQAEPKRLLGIYSSASPRPPARLPCHVAAASVATFSLVRGCLTQRATSPTGNLVLYYTAHFHTDMPALRAAML